MGSRRHAISCPGLEIDIEAVRFLLPSPRAKIGGVRKSLSTQGVRAMGNVLEAGTGHFTTTGGPAALRVERNLAMTAEADEFLAHLARRTGLSEGNVIRLALGMLKTALDAKEQGKHVGVTRNPDALDFELVGF